MITKSVIIMFRVANMRMKKASVTLIVIPLTAFLKNAFSPSMKAQKCSAF